MATEEKEDVQQVKILAPLPQTERGRGFHLGGTCKIKERLLYCSSNLVIQRSMGDFSDVTINPEHSCDATVAKFSANGEWICSGDKEGKCIVWAHQSFVIKNEIMVGKGVLDIAWSADSQRIFACGVGKDEKGKVFPWNTNNKLGEISGAQKSLLSCDFKPSRPFRVTACSEDFGVYFYTGPPFKFQTYDKTHTNYANCVRYNADGSFYISVGSDKKILVFDGNTGKMEREIVDKKGGHKGSIYECAWSNDGKQFITASADKTVKLWDFESGTVQHTWTFAEKPTVWDMQVSCLWLGDNIISVSLSGKINLLKVGEKGPSKVITGHRKSILDMCVDGNGNIYSCDTDSRVVKTNAETMDAVDMEGDPHGGTQIKLCRVGCDGKNVWTVGTDDLLVRSDGPGAKLGKKDAGIKLNGAGRCMAASHTNPNMVVIGTHKGDVMIVKDDAVANTVTIGGADGAPSAIAFSPDDSTIAVGTDKNKIIFIGASDCKVSKTISSTYVTREITDVAYSPDGKFLASSDRNRHIWVWDTTGDFSEPVNRANTFQYHTATPSSLSWNPSGTMLASGGHDCQIYVWKDPTSGKCDYSRAKNAFHGAIKRVQFISDDTIVASGADSTVRVFKVAA